MQPNESGEAVNKAAKSDIDLASTKSKVFVYEFFNDEKNQENIERMLNSSQDFESKAGDIAAKISHQIAAAAKKSGSSYPEASALLPNGSIPLIIDMMGDMAEQDVPDETKKSIYKKTLSRLKKSEHLGEGASAMLEGIAKVENGETRSNEPVRDDINRPTRS